MMKRPLLKLPEPIPFEPRPGPRGGPRVILPPRTRQVERLTPRFERLMRVFADSDALLELRNDPTSIAPERAVVFEVAGILKDFYAQAADLGLEYLGDFEDDYEPNEEFYIKDRTDRSIAGRVYLAMPDVRALRELLSLWRLYKNGRNMPDGKTAWRDLFSKLIDVRPWGPQDRVPQETIDFWKHTLANSPDIPVRFEIELWFHEDISERDQSFARIEQELQTIRGKILQHVVIPEIRYDAALVDLPPNYVNDIINHEDVNIVRVDEIMFLRPQAGAIHQPKEHLEGMEGDGLETKDQIGHREPIAALLDGLPIQNHTKLDGRIIVEDPDDLSPTYGVDQREHGTSMASLVIHGDLNKRESPIGRPLFVLPVMRLNERGMERTPNDQLFVDVIYRAIRRIKEGEGDQPASAPEVVLVNFSLGDEWRPFSRVMSPLGRLIDYLAYEYKILFLVSAGNVLDSISVRDYQSGTDFENAAPEDREKAILRALDENKAYRTLYSPAEAVNALTIGSAHKGSGFNNNLPASLIDPFTDEKLPNIASALGLGHRKALKPDLLFEGGRTPVRIVGVDNNVTIKPATHPARLFGVKSAFPDHRGGIRYEDFTWGTSVATALATRAGHQIHDVIMDEDGGSNHIDTSESYMPLVIKALLVHGASWGSKGAMLDEFFGPRGTGQHVARRDNIARLLGYGVPNISRVLDCTGNRATLLGCGQIDQDSAVLYRIPLPEDLEGERALRTLTITLVWFSPINPRHQGYRMASLDVSEMSENRYWIVSNRKPHQPTDKTVVRGTVFHERRTGEDASVFVEDGSLQLRISCRATAGDLYESVPYALAVSFEVEIGAGIQVYEQIRNRLETQVRATVGVEAFT